MSVQKQSAVLAGLATLATGAIGGGIFLLASIPLPWVLGSLAATALISRTPVRQTMPPSWRGIAMVIVGTMLGAGFNSDVAQSAVLWLPSVIVMCVLSVAFWVISLAIFSRWSDMDPATALLSSVPGGLSVVTSIADDYNADTRRIALSHTARLVILLVLTPIMLQGVSDYDLTAAARQSLFVEEALDLSQSLMLFGCALLGFLIAKLIRLPSGLLVIPLVLSALAHATGLITMHVPGPLSILAQVIIGCSAGVKFSGYRFADIARDGWLSFVVGALLSITSMACAWGMAAALDLSLAPLLLSYLPGGAPELGVVSLAVQADPAMVAVHHVARVFLIIGLIPFVMRFALGDKKSR
ncbi:hypothetical protein SAMN04487974_11116 [Pelagibacterium luteolum]|uniref:Ammonia monooxygenase n=1 Tax=Pelagibacterium luteolum TaxID=440168 RepID=A0A1G7XWA4_9HYPH|nr:hypothetical protein SAMN04487974_11116 [Pelagibacterium luteolum]